MEGSRISLHLLFFLLIGQVSHTSITQPQTTNAIYPTDITSITQEENDTSSSPTKATTGCLIKPQLGFIVVTCAGGLVLFLLVSTVVLASQVCSLRRQARAPRPARSNVDLVSGAGYWDTEHSEGGIVGPCDTSVMLEEVRLDGEEDEEQGEEEEEEKEEEQAEGVRGQTGDARTTGEIAMQMQSSSSRDLCLEIPQDLENMPLVV
ncbi:zinc finger homeobox protein 3-like [Oncorhynchus nerka]|uniref:zinc finger homeobox protein 3-like n=1 Tax=Oncorhynchus nerka TaxID=8023 RepID=UPI00113211A6|nr:zinc finger homeobox protein 3-like [Oncorhynchus nerka]XP_029528075.1 zinc finger homeobox protein 3-like [Oncorhynchus nerka]XP_029528076.1 zinc finger homeobox protein 3-like [Oncorhynchus nerka]